MREGARRMRRNAESAFSGRVADGYTHHGQSGRPGSFYEERGDAFDRLVELGIEAAHLAIDVPAAVIGLGANVGTSLTEPRRAAAPSGSVPILSMVGTRGSTMRGTLHVESDRSMLSTELDLQVTALYGPGKISRRSVKWSEPVYDDRFGSPVIHVSVKVPATVPRGIYGGLLQSESWPSVRIVLDVHVR